MVSFKSVKTKGEYVKCKILLKSIVLKTCSNTEYFQNSHQILLNEFQISENHSNANCSHNNTNNCKNIMAVKSVDK